LICEFANRQKCLVPDIRLYLSRRAENLRLDMPTPQLFDPPDPLTMLTLPFFFWASSFIENAQAACFHYVMIAIKIYFTRLTFEYGWTQQEEDAGLFAL
jgi:hypothetical protein